MLAVSLRSEIAGVAFANVNRLSSLTVETFHDSVVLGPFMPRCIHDRVQQCDARGTDANANRPGKHRFRGIAQLERFDRQLHGDGSKYWCWLRIEHSRFSQRFQPGHE